MTETWTKINWNRNYSVSSLGRVRNDNTGRVLKEDSSNGYRRVTIPFEGKQKHLRVHRLVAEAFLPNPLGLSDVDHINGKRDDNRVENLQWLSHFENVRKANSRPVINLTTGQVYDSLTDAAHDCDRSPQCIWKAIQTKGTSAGYHWNYFETQG